MSLILDALRKSERDRRAIEAPSPANLAADESSPRVGWPVWAVVLLITINASVLAGLWWFGRADHAPAPAPIPIATAPAPSSPSGEPPAAAVTAVQVAPLVAVPPAANLAQPTAVQPSGAIPVPAPTSPPVAVSPQPAVQQAPPVQAVPAMPAPPPSASRQPPPPRAGQRPAPNGRYSEPVAVGGDGSAAAQQQDLRVDEEDAESDEEEVDTDEEQAPVAAGGADIEPEPEQPLSREALQRLARQKGWSDAPPPLQQPAVRPAPLRRDDATIVLDDNIPSVDGLPASLQEKVPALKMNLHAYAKLPSERFAVINSQRYEVGDNLPGGAQVIDIRPDGVILQIEGTPFKLRR